MNPHGTRARYKTQKCRCQPCRDATARYERYRRYDTELGRPRTVDATGTRRRLHALMAIGWSAPAIAARMDPPTIGQIVSELTHRPGVYAATAARVADVYDRLSMVLPETNTAGQRISVSKTRSFARRSGWLPPLAWDDDLIDDPTHQPARQTVRTMRRSLIKYDAFVDETAVERRLEGDKTVRLSDADRAELLRRWEASGRSLNECERFTGVAPFRTRKEMAS